jgi:Flp pilus assembly protein TadD
LPILQDKAIAVNRSAGRFDAALTQLDSLLAQGQRLPELYHRKGLILREAGRTEEARQAFQSALANIEKVPPARQNSAAMQALLAKTLAELK